MSRKTCKRKVWGLVNPFTRNQLEEPLSKELQDDIQFRELSALEAMTHGSATVQEWGDLDAFVKICATSAKVGVGPEALQVCEIARQCLHEASIRHASTGRMGLTGEGIQALRDVFGYSEVQRQSISGIDYGHIVNLSAIKRQRVAA